MSNPKSNVYDAIVVGSGISGGWAAKELCEKGLETLVIERGRNIDPAKDYHTAFKESWELPNRGEMDAAFRNANPIMGTVVNQANQHFFVKDAGHPYVQKKPFGWIRGYQVGGKSLMWARMTQRWSDLDFEANVKEVVSIDWPIRYRDIAPWYSYVEKFAGITGNRDGLPQIPDGEFLPPMELTCMEIHFKSVIEKQFPGRNLVQGRCANLTQAHNGRGPCMFRHRCDRGCPFSGYFSSNTATLPAAAATGKMTLRPDSVVHSVIYDEKSGKATGVRVIDSETLQTTEYFAKLIFLNAGTLNTTLILLNSTSNRFPNGLGNDSGVLGHYLMDHNYGGGAYALYDGFQDKYYYGKRPTAAYIPRFRNFGNDRQTHFIRGYAYSVRGRRERGVEKEGAAPIGAAFKENLTKIGPWSLKLNGMGEHLPYFENHVALSQDKTDQWGMPLLEIECEFKENEKNMSKDMANTAAEMLEAAGCRNIEPHLSSRDPGRSIHEMGTARMGRDPRTSMLNGNNQMHAVKNVFVSDGACMTSSACQNPSLTYMALTARAANFAVSEMRKLNI